MNTHRDRNNKEVVAVEAKQKLCDLRATVKWGGRVCAELNDVIRIPVTVWPFTRQRKREREREGWGSEGGRETASREDEN